MPAYRGLVDAARQIARQEGLLGFYKGLVPSLLLVRQNKPCFAACVAVTPMVSCIPSPCWDHAGHCTQAELAHKATIVLTGFSLEGWCMCVDSCRSQDAFRWRLLRRRNIQQVVMLCI